MADCRSSNCKMRRTLSSAALKSDREEIESAATFNPINEKAHRTIVGKLIGKLSHFFHTAPSRSLVAIATVYWKVKGIRGEELAEKQKSIYQEARLGTFPIGITAGLAVAFLALLYIFGKLN